MDNQKLVDIKKHIKNKFLRYAYSYFSFPIESFLGVKKLNRDYERIKNLPIENNFFENTLDVLDGSYDVSEEDLKKIPKEGPLIVVANHPHGAMDGLIIGSMLLRVRSDVKLLANFLLGYMDRIRPWFLPVNPFGGKKAMSENISSMKETFRVLNKGGCIATFPSGTVSYYKWRERHVADPEWNHNIASIARKTNATILPVYFEGKNSWLFYALGCFHPILRTTLLAREMYNTSRKKTIRVKIGTPIPPRKLEQFKDDKELTSWMRLNTYLLSQKNINEEPEISFFQSGHIKRFYKKILHPLKKDKELILPISGDVLQKEIDELPETSCLIKGEKFSVYCAYAWQLKWTILEIGRLREKTFREIGEGTGKSVDNDEFDQYYMHIFMWDSENKKIAGAYRVGRTDKIISSIGVQGLYTSTLFKIKQPLLDKISPALEMGRSFIVSEYQKKGSTLAILWRGIGIYLSKHPQYRTLYGPVSITTEYNSLSKDLMVQFLIQHKKSQELSKFVSAKKPHKLKLKSDDKRALLDSANDIDKISALISEIEVDNKGIPTLLKHYLKLNGELLAFNVDVAFGSCIDGLIMVDMTKTDPKLLKSYMGVQETIDYRKYHGLETPELK